VEYRSTRKSPQTAGLTLQNAKPYKQQDSLSVELAQQRVYVLFLESVRQCSPDRVLREFAQLFIHLSAQGSPSVHAALTTLLSAGNESDFRYMLQRCCYILVNNWNITGNYQYAHYLIELFLDPAINQPTKITELKTLRNWVRNFANSENYESLKLFIGGHTSHWSNRYSDYLLTSQYVDMQNSVEQRQLAIALSQRIKSKFKFDLALYTARSNSKIGECGLNNPTGLGNEVLYLIKIILTKQRKISYRSSANLFLNQLGNDSLFDFKIRLHQYLDLPKDGIRDALEVVELFETELVAKLYEFYDRYDHNPISQSLIHKTCNRLISCLTIDQNGEPSELFTVMLHYGNPLNFVIIFLKIILICEASRIHLETCIACLIKYYSRYTEDECRSLINFLDIFNVTFSIYAKDIEYNLVRMSNQSYQDSSLLNLEDYRIFSQTKSPLRSS